ncbi:MAG: GGDEF domain-containing protein [Actinomycetota bacterium]
MIDDSESDGAQEEDPRPPVQTGDDRDRTADDRDRRAEAHDELSEARDERADARDERAEARDDAADGIDIGAAADRAGALRDRRGGASDRTQAADDRDAAAVDRTLAARERAVSSIDGLTGAYRRDAGTLELEREIARAQRTNLPLVIAFTDVDGLKETNDSLGHPAGDMRLRQTVECIRTHLRSYDLIVRFGGDEFVCVLVDLSISGAAKRFEAVNADLAATGNGSITAGLARLRSGDTLEAFIARADEALYKERDKKQR